MALLFVFLTCYYFFVFLYTKKTAKMCQVFKTPKIQNVSDFIILCQNADEK